MPARLPDTWSLIVENGFPFNGDIKQTAWQNERTGTVITIPTNTVDERYIVEILDRNGNHIEVNRFWERDDAIDYALKWMRRNPNGHDDELSSFDTRSIA